jgi:isopenicillin N synthase-like dioxygenase
MPGSDGGPPTIDLHELSEMQIVEQIATACQTYGFFQITSHGINQELIQRFQQVCQTFFQHTTLDGKYHLKRNENNARGYFDDELTKQKRDWKQCLDVGVPGSRNWTLADNNVSNACLDGYNQFPPTMDETSNFRAVVVEYFDECAKLSHRLATYMAQGLLLLSDDSGNHRTLQQLSDEYLRQLWETHTSYLRVNYYPPCSPSRDKNGDDDNDSSSPLGVRESVVVIHAPLIVPSLETHTQCFDLQISPHKDAGFLTVLLQDEDCHSLQVWDESVQHWCTVVPARHALTINTGDMAQVWSNGLYRAPLHRVLTHESKPRHSAPFFYNPGYGMWVSPIAWKSISSLPYDNNDDEDRSSSTLMYHPVLWGYYRAVRFAGDLTDLGVEIQISDFEVANSSPSSHVDKQRRFAALCDFQTAFSVEAYRELLQE